MHYHERLCVEASHMLLLILMKSLIVLIVNFLPRLPSLVNVYTIYITNSVSWCSSASTAWHPRISLSSYNRSRSWSHDSASDLPARQRSTIVVPATRRSTLGDRSFSATGTRAWNSLPPTVSAASTLSSFRRYLKSHLFTKSFPS